MGVTIPALLTFEEFEQMPEQPGKQELINGELFELPPASRKHNRKSLNILFQFKAALDAAHARGEAADLGELCIEGGYKLGGGWVQPDVSITHANQPEGKYFEGAPAIAIEVVSPSNTSRHLQIKTQLYFAHGAREVWQVFDDPTQILIDTGGHYRILAAGDRVTTPLLPGFAPTVRELLEAEQQPATD
jgi:Uma2 family endonuclease